MTESTAMSVPSSSNDDRALRTPLARELFTLNAMNAGQLERAASTLSHQGGLFATRLVEAGVGAAEVVSALSRVSGLTPAPVASLRAPAAELVEGLELRVMTRLLAAPFGRRDDKLLIAYANPLAARLPEALALPAHEPYVALEAEVRRCLLALFGAEWIGPPPPAVGTPLPPPRVAAVPDESGEAEGPLEHTSVLFSSDAEGLGAGEQWSVGVGGEDGLSEEEAPPRGQAHGLEATQRLHAGAQPPVDESAEPPPLEATQRLHAAAPAREDAARKLGDGGDLREAARKLEDMGDLREASESLEDTGDLREAARRSQEDGEASKRLEDTGDLREAVRRSQEDGEASKRLEDTGDLREAARSLEDREVSKRLEDTGDLREAARSLEDREASKRLEDTGDLREAARSLEDREAARSQEDREAARRLEDTGDLREAAGSLEAVRKQEDREAARSQEDREAARAQEDREAARAQEDREAARAQEGREAARKLEDTGDLREAAQRAGAPVEPSRLTTAWGDEPSSEVGGLEDTGDLEVDVKRNGKGPAPLAGGSWGGQVGGSARAELGAQEPWPAALMPAVERQPEVPTAEVQFGALPGSWAGQVGPPSQVPSGGELRGKVAVESGWLVPPTAAADATRDIPLPPADWSSPAPAAAPPKLSRTPLVPSERWAGPDAPEPALKAPSEREGANMSTLGASTFEASAVPDSQPQEVGGYTLIKALGETPLAQVFLARDGGGPEVTFQWLRPEHAAVPGFSVHVRKVAEQLLGLRHPHLVSVVDLGDALGRPFLVHEREESGSVMELMRRMGKLPAPLAADLFAQLLAALGFAHGHGLTHGALSPEGMLLNEQGQLRVAGLGDGELAAVLGLPAPALASPEQRARRPSDARSDLHMAGQVLFYWLTGKPWRQDPTPPLLFELEPTVPPLLEALVERLLEEDVGRRFESATQVLAELRPYLDQERELYPLLVAGCMGSPEKMQQQMSRDQAKAYLTEARGMLDGAPGRRTQVALTLYKATLLDPNEPVAAQALHAVCQADRFQFGSSTNPRIVELERQVAVQPTADALQQLATLYRGEGNLLRALVCLKKYARLHPPSGQLPFPLAQLLDPKLTPPRPATTRETNRAVDPSTAPPASMHAPAPQQEAPAVMEKPAARGRVVVIVALLLAALLAGLVFMQWRARLRGG